MALDVDAIVNRIRTEAARRLLAAAITLQSAHRSDLSKGNPSPHDHPAPKGDYPRLRTGGGRAGVVVTPTSVNEVIATGSVSVGHRAGGHHLYFLAGRGWKGLQDTYARERARLRALIEGSGTP
jgi:hypothetical protein